MKLSALFLSIVLTIFINESNQENILIVSLMLSHSHHIWNEAIAIGLVQNGHNVTMLSHDYTDVNHANFTIITLNGLYQVYDYTQYTSATGQPRMSPFSLPSQVDTEWNFNLDICNHDLKHPTLHKILLSYPKDFKFDAILWDHAAGECLYPIIQHFGNPPLIGLSPLGITNSIEAMYNGHTFKPFVQTHFWRRLLNSFNTMYSNYKRNAYYKPKSVALTQRVFLRWNRQEYDRMENRFSLCLVNWNAGVNQAQPLSPNLIPLGGIQIKRKQKLPDLLEQVFSEVNSGVIYFSLGSNIKSEYLPINILQMFNTCFAQLRNYRIIWKITPPSQLNISSNIVTIPWAPQTDILAQTKTKVFITNGGSLSIQEAAYFGVPILGIPIHLDHTYNIETITRKGGGEMITLQEMVESKEDLFCEHLKTLLHYENYAETMQDISLKYKDVQMKPLNKAVYWIEYVLKYGEANHLKPLAKKMKGFKVNNLDLYVLFIVILVMFYVILKCLLKRCYIKSDNKKFY